MYISGVFDRIQGVCHRVIDLRSDMDTKPAKEMRYAMAFAAGQLVTMFMEMIRQQLVRIYRLQHFV